jgi:ATP-dependent DNA helicase RecQ
VDRQAHPGRALCVWGDAGWGDWVARGKYREHRFADALVQACADLLDRWRPDPFPAWVTCIPSWHHADLMPDFARRLAQALGLPFRMALEKTATRPPQKDMANSVQQARNLDGALAASLADGPWPSGPVLLVDDMVDSRWTLTLAAWLLRDNGVSDVWPLALAQTTPDT